MKLTRLALLAGGAAASADCLGGRGDGGTSPPTETVDAHVDGDDDTITVALLTAGGTYRQTVRLT